MSDNSSQSAALSSKRLSTAVPTTEEYALLREAYAETYPVRPLLNAIDAKDAEIERLRTERDELTARCFKLSNDLLEAGVTDETSP